MVWQRIWAARLNSKKMNLNNFTIKSQEAIQKAQELALVNQNQSIETGHLLKGLTVVDENVIDYLLKKLGANVNHLQTKLTEQLNVYPKVSGATSQYLSNDSNQALKLWWICHSCRINLYSQCLCLWC